MHRALGPCDRLWLDMLLVPPQLEIPIDFSEFVE
jgi:hypothetical protein